MTTRPMWRRFIGAVSTFAFELDRCGFERSFASLEARRALDTIVLENLDLLE